MSQAEQCEHKQFFAQVNVARLEDTGGFYADITIKCEECNTPFHFVGVPGGLSPRGPRVDPFGLELRAPILPGPLPVPATHMVFEVDSVKSTGGH
jgi:hypothetical protein